MSFESPPLESGSVHVWSAALRPGRSGIERSRAILSADEIERAGRFRFERDHDRYVTARGTLRRLLAHYGGVDEREICFRYLEKGKPEIEAPPLERPLWFNVSHSQDTGLFAFTHDGEIGVDIEEKRPDRDLLGISTRFFSTDEDAWLHEGAAESQEALVERFFTLWTRKEAYLKARGVGITVTLQEIDVSHGGRDEKIELRVGSEEPSDGDWHILDLPVPSGFRAAVCTALPITKLDSFEV